MRFILFFFFLFFCFKCGQAQTTSITKAHVSITSENGLYNETIIAFLPDATVDVDEQYDVIKLIANPNISLYTFIGIEKYAIQALPPIENEVTVPLGLNCLPIIAQQLELIVFDNFESGQVMLLRDLELDETVVMNLNSTYDFVKGAVNLDQRFQLIFLPSIKVQVLPETCIGNNGSLYFTNPSQYGGTLQVKNISFNTPEFIIENFTGDTLIDQLIYGQYQIQFNDTFGRVQNTLEEIAYGYSIQASIAASHDTVEVGDSTFQLFATTNLDVFTEWDFGDNTPFSNETNPFHNYETPGNFVVNYRCTNSFCTIFDSLNVVVFQIPDTIPVDTLLVSQISNQSILLFPNPVSENLTIEGIEYPNPVTLHVFSLDGRRIFSKQILNNEIIEMRHWKAGAYVFEIKSNAKKPFQKVVIKSP